MAQFKNNGKLKLLIIVGTRPEIIRLAAVINKCREYFDCLLAHTGQNYDYNLNGVFFKDLKLADPDVSGRESSLVREGQGTVRRFRRVLHVKHARALFREGLLADKVPDAVFRALVVDHPAVAGPRAVYHDVRLQSFYRLFARDESR